MVPIIASSVKTINMNLRTTKNGREMKMMKVRNTKRKK